LSSKVEQPDDRVFAGTGNLHNIIGLNHSDFSANIGGNVGKVNGTSEQSGKKRRKAERSQPSILLKNPAWTASRRPSLEEIC